ncbi:MAG: DUF547 domain-containing protein [Flavobacteriales bacterium]|nr:DUF547 domain-containing protein [Flavobacteriia bacterium]NCP04901.1 DUF547 domain-containing protein [Flavobacteriales bacterium]PIV95221.1 MAG: DUF547 domain-containing protein [Flavobacteriaceae bacterium CG17_big_fil_post_rev_8_21_14_2_50_33_15]PIY11699.1 MAG: DUF547 domain-containing protein [Flavobacteriaceae bacterium CG_4_10_14_3_um_filter_33_47]PJB16948.1 MAG: DUF547 domain-containing protein [Flavobacteriaceae bacterium CG_4_9_14_3_um_filter_33_16]
MPINPKNNLVEVSRALLLKVKLEQPTELEIQTLEHISISDFQQQLKTDTQKKAFWINIYNACFQILSGFEDAGMKAIYTDKSVKIAQNRFSLDDIEHGILRKYRWKKSFGYLPNPLVSPLIKSLAVDTVDYRIHFALNCGAKSCPPIAFYSEDTLDNDLNKSMHSFITSETAVDDHKKKIVTSKLLFWYCADFGGLSQIKKLLQHVLIRNLTGYKLSFKTYNWETHLKNYITN